MIAKEVTINSTFIGGQPTWANACVGNNGDPGYVEYSKGFSAASIYLLEKIIASRGLCRVDDLIYPICFNFRHSVELRLKGAIEELIQLAALKKIKLEFDFKSSHDIGNIWSFYKRQSETLDGRYNPNNKKIEKIIDDISSIDSTGQTFRYPVSSESQKHLTDIGGLINCRVLLTKFKALEADLDELHFLNKYLVEEYRLGAFTNKLSRAMIFEISKLLPNRNSWKDKCFSSIKSKIQREYNLSSREFSKCLDLIQENYEAAPLIDVSLNTLGITESQIEQLICFWVRLHPNFRDRTPTSYTFPESGDDFFNEILENSKIEREVVRELKPQLTPEYIAGIRSLYYFSSELGFSEVYKFIYYSNLDTAKSECHDWIRVEESFIHMISKTNMIDGILESLFFLRLNVFAEKLISRYDLENLVNDIEGLRTRGIFKKKSICGY